MIDEGCVYTTTGQRIAMVPRAVADSFDEPFRLAEYGEPSVPVWMEDEICVVHEETTFTWRRVSLDRLDAVQHAIDMNCDAGCHCRCHGTS